MTSKNQKRALTVQEAANYACVSRGTIENWLIKHLLPFENLPGSGSGKYCFRRIRKCDLDEFLNKFYIEKRENNNLKNNNKIVLLPRDA